MAGHQGPECAQGGGGLGAAVESLLQLGHRPEHRFSPESLAAGEVAEQGPMAPAHALGDGGGADRLRRPIASQFEQPLHRVQPPLGGGDGDGPGQAWW